jgi:hypothetical protein
MGESIHHAEEKSKFHRKSPTWLVIAVTARHRNAMEAWRRGENRRTFATDERRWTQILKKNGRELTRNTRIAKKPITEKRRARRKLALTGLSDRDHIKKGRLGIFEKVRRRLAPKLLALL